MNKLLRCLVFALLIVSFAVGSSFAFMAHYNEGEVLVVMKAPMGAYSTMSASAYAEALESQATSFAQRTSLSMVCSYAELSQSSGTSIAFFKSDGKTTAQLIKELMEDPDVLSVSANHKREFYGIPKGAYSAMNDPLLGKQWGINRINIFETWDNYAKSGQTVYVAVIDSGVDYNHQDLKDNIARDSEGRVIGKSFYGNGTFENNDPMDTLGHGTHVAGIIGAVGNNGRGIVGVHHNNIKIIPVNVGTGDGPYDGAWDADIIKGLNYVVSLKKSGLNIRVANMSLGGPSDPAHEKTTAMQIAVEQLSDVDVVIVIAAGNDGSNLASGDIGTIGGGRRYVFPACFWMIPNKITVGSINPVFFKRSVFSNFDNGDGAETLFRPEPSVRFVDMAAPGDYILSTVPGNKYEYYDGTSMAAPFVAGAAALLSSFFPDKTAGEIKDCILQNTFANEDGKHWTHGALNVGKAYLQFDTNPVTPIKPNPTFEEMRPIVLEISIDKVVVDKEVPIEVYPNPEGQWSTNPSRLAEIVPDPRYGDERPDKGILIAKSIGKVEVVYSVNVFNRGVQAARKEVTVLDIYHQGGGGCKANVIPLMTLAVPLVFFTYMASRRRK